jgi:DNA anti-recombination protein RmuC
MMERNILQIYEEMKNVQTQIGQLQYKLTRLQQELNNACSRDYGAYTTTEKGNTYISFNNGSEIESVLSEETIRGNGWFIGVDLAKEESFYHKRSLKI